MMIYMSIKLIGMYCDFLIYDCRYNRTVILTHFMYRDLETLNIVARRDGRLS